MYIVVQLNGLLFTVMGEAVAQLYPLIVYSCR